ncbi:MAG TPA: hypothetical protein VMY37_38415 [Thermoguttaceae bacterium]|nr:hypothetical protein [Thermoguttaceae bacterium]
MNDHQKDLFAKIEEMKHTPGHDTRALKQLVRRLVSYDDIAKDLYRQQHRTEGRPGSRSVHFGKWRRDDEDLIP